MAGRRPGGPPPKRFPERLALFALLALFGERVTMQFMSQATGWADNIILAMAPLGVITAIVGAIRIGGPHWLRAIIGRARESRATQIVRVMGKAPIREFVVLFLKEQNPKSGDDEKDGYIQVMELRDGEREREERKLYDKFRRKETQEKMHGNTTDHTEGNEAKTAEDDPREDIGSESNGNEDSNTQDPNKYLEKHESINLEETGQNGPASLDECNLNQPITVIQNVTAQTPNLTLNVRNKLGRGELYFVAATGTFLQLGVLVFSGFTAYHPPFRLEWLKNDMPVADYAYPCNATGTLLLVVGMLVCSYVVESSTTEDSYRPAEHEGREARVVWLQRSGIVNDQRFESFAVYPQEPSALITTSKRKRSQSGLDLVITVVGTVVSLVGFVLQFVGLRGLHWSSSIAQLIATGSMVMLRAWVRRNLATLPEYAPLLPGHELDWLAMSLGADTANPMWMSGPQHRLRPWMSGVEYDNDNSSLAMSAAADDMAENLGPDQQKEATPQATYLGVECEASPFSQSNRVHQLMLQGPAATEAIALTHAIEITMDSLFGTTNTVGDVIRWSLPAIGLLGESSHSGSVEFRVERGETGRWRAFSDEIEAALSLWLYSVYEDEDPLGGGGKLLGRESEAAKGVLDIKPLRSGDDAWLRTKGTLAKRNLKLLGPHTLALHRDLRWWVPDCAARVVAACAADPGVEIRRFLAPEPNKLEVAVHRVAGCASSWNYTEKTSVYTAPIPREAIPRDEDIDPQWTLAVETHTPLATLYSQHLLTAFMWAAAKEMQPLPGSAEIWPAQMNGTADAGAPEWQSFEVRDTQIQTLAEDIRGTGIGTLDDVYLAIIPPLSMHNKLPQPDTSDWALRYVAAAQQSGQWEETTAAYLWLFRAARTFPGHNFNRAVVLLVVYWATIMNGINRSQALYLDHRVQAYLLNARSALEQLLQARPRINDPDMEGRAPLHYALVGGNRGAMELLIGAGADINRADVWGWTPLHLAAHRGRKDLLESGLDNEAQDIDRRTPLHLASVAGRQANVKRLIEAGTDLSRKDAFGDTALHLAAKRGREPVVQCLVEAGAYIDSKNRKGNTPLHRAAQEKHDTVVRCLITRGADANAQDVLGWTPLHEAANQGDEAMFQYLV
ncbi:uncharacterized protein C8A04DRAFT_33569 [Dichotomopilus funicola]|uniref:Uncharacterized protein n=1 Tax=Dichotomopilus funicola TaxID=1934379 RepID=A0AAN6VAX8_9PEZI|nr:hypothetical protein C8A04DRAFT_33569 [Dichotomopilus funicola]